MTKFFSFAANFIKFSLIFLGFLGLAAVVYLESNLPSVESLKDVQLQVPLRIYSQDGKLIAEYGEKRRDPVKLEEVPKDLINAILATEDVRFYSHPGVDLKGIIRAAILLISNGKKQQGGSTITMQVARNFFLTRKKTYLRKINEILLALKIEKYLSKEEILELYLNKIYLGKRAYGVAAAAKVYYGKELNELSLAQMAMIAGLPQAPSSKNPLNNPEGALERREHVLRRMLSYDFISEDRFNIAMQEPSTAKYHSREKELEASYIAEMVRQKLVDVYGEDAYDKGFEVYTTIDSANQEAANAALARAILEYDHRHGYRKHITKFDIPKGTTVDTEELLKEWQEKLLNIPKINILEPAVVISNFDDKSHVMLWDGNFTDISFKTMSWAGKSVGKYVGKKPEKPSDLLSAGDVIYVYKQKNGRYAFAQAPEIEGSIVALDPHTGAVLGLVGGFDFYKSKFNRVTQAERQSGSNFKPFIYSVALENGFNAATIINDAPIVEEDSYGEFDWRPQNHTKQFYGPTRLRLGVTKSRNLVTIRVLKALGLEHAITELQKFGFDEQAVPKALSMALGAGSITPLELAVGYCAFPNGGYKVSPYLITKIKDYNDKIIFEHEPTVICHECFKEVASTQPKEDDIELEADKNTKDLENTEEIITPIKFAGDKIQVTSSDDNKDKKSFTAEDSNLSNSRAIFEDKKIAPKAISRQTAYIMSTILQDAIQTGTGRRAKTLNRKDIAGKTGSTNNHLDSWYSGFNPDIVVTTWMGYDEPRSIREYASSTTLPMWIYFMEQALKKLPEKDLEQPDGIVTLKIDPNTGMLAHENQEDAIFEVFSEKSMPQELATESSGYLNPIDNETNTTSDANANSGGQIQQKETTSLF